MFVKSLLMSIYTETQVHPGSGTAINRPIDLPIQRERHTQFPLIQSSTLKGVLKSFGSTAGIPEDKIKSMFGPDDASAAGLITINDAKILAFPVRTLAGVFAWITCPLVLDRFRRDIQSLNSSFSYNLPSFQETDALVQNETSVAVDNAVIIEDIKLAKKRDDLSNITSVVSKLLPSDQAYNYVREKIRKDLVIVNDTLFKELVSLTTEVVARIAIDQGTGTAKSGALWYEEYLPTDTIMYSIIMISK